MKQKQVTEPALAGTLLYEQQGFNDARQERRPNKRFDRFKGLSSSYVYVHICIYAYIHIYVCIRSAPPTQTTLSVEIMTFRAAAVTYWGLSPSIISGNNEPESPKSDLNELR